METDKILAQELAKLGAIGGRIGGGFGGPCGAIGGEMGGSGAIIAARFLPTVDYQHTVVYNNTLEQAIISAHTAIMATEGYKKMTNAGSDFEIPVLSAIIGSGAMNMNPAIVLLVFEAVSSMVTNIHITGFAKEGLIKQKAAQKAVMRVVAGLQNRMS